MVINEALKGLLEISYIWREGFMANRTDWKSLRRFPASLLQLQADRSGCIQMIDTCLKPADLTDSVENYITCVPNYYAYRILVSKRYIILFLN